MPSAVELRIPKPPSRDSGTLLPASRFCMLLGNNSDSYLVPCTAECFLCDRQRAFKLRAVKLQDLKGYKMEVWDSIPMNEPMNLSADADAGARAAVS
jgi:hypothetical protein